MAAVVWFWPLPSHGSTTPDAQSTGVSPVTDIQLQQVGFVEAKAEPANGNRFQGPAVYWRVQVNPAKTTEPGDILMVLKTTYIDPGTSGLYAYGSDSHAFTVTGGQGQESTINDGRTAVSIVKNGTYVVIVGPGKQAVEALADLMGASL